MVPCALAAAGAGCGPDYSPNTYASSAVQQANKVDLGIVIGLRPVGVAANGMVGAVAGAGAGGIAGAQVPGSAVSQAFGALGGSVIGGIVGTTVEHATADTNAYEDIVRKPNGDLLSVTQRDEVPLAIGQKVLLIAGNQARIVPDYTVTTDTQARATPSPPAQPAAAQPAPSPASETKPPAPASPEEQPAASPPSAASAEPPPPPTAAAVPPGTSP